MSITSSVYEGRGVEKPWETAGRGTVAGRLLFTLYNGCAEARQKGNQYSLQNKIDILRHLASRANKPDQDTRLVRPPRKKPIVRVPKFPTKRPDYEDMPFYYMCRPGKRSGNIILQQMKEDYKNKGPPPIPSKPPLGPKEKERLQKIMEWAGRDFKESNIKLREKPRKLVKGSIEECEVLMGKIANEISEREVFLRDMMKLGRLSQYQDQILGEINDRVRQMKILHNTLEQQEEAQIAKSNDFKAMQVEKLEDLKEVQHQEPIDLEEKE